MAAVTSLLNSARVAEPLPQAVRSGREPPTASASVPLPELPTPRCGGLLDPCRSHHSDPPTKNVNGFFLRVNAYGAAIQADQLVASEETVEARTAYHEARSLLRYDVA